MVAQVPEHALPRGFSSSWHVPLQRFEVFIDVYHHLVLHDGYISFLRQITLASHMNGFEVKFMEQIQDTTLDCIGVPKNVEDTLRSNLSGLALTVFAVGNDEKSAKYTGALGVIAAALYSRCIYTIFTSARLSSFLVHRCDDEGSMQPWANGRSRVDDFRKLKRRFLRVLST